MGRFALFCILLFTLLSWNLSAADGEVLLSASSPQVAAGGEFVLKLSAEGSVTPTLLETPDAITVLSVSRSSYSQSINGQTTMESSSNYNVAIEQPGEYTIGPLKAKLGSKEFTTNVVKVKVLAPEKISVPVMDKKSGDVVNSEIGDLVFGSGEFPGGRTKFYVGEDIPLSLKLYVADNSNFSLSYPVIDAGKALFADYSKSGGDNKDFAPVFTSRGETSERKYDIYHFDTTFRALAPGKLQIKAVENAKMLIRESRRSYSFFDNGVRSEVYKIQFKVPEITIMPLPLGGGESNFTGLIGDWQISAGLSEVAVRQGEAVNLEFELSGIGAVDNLNAPELKITGFRVFPPEVKKRPGRLPNETNSITINYVLIPLQQGENQAINLKLSTFNPISGEYKIKSFDFKLNVSGSVATVTSASPEEVDNNNLGNNISDANKLESPAVLLGWKNEPGNWITLPLAIPGWIFWLWLLPAPLLWAGVEVWRYQRIRRQSDTAYLRKNTARKRYRAVLKEIGNCPPEKLPEVVNEQLLPCLTDYWNLPPGATANALSELPQAREISETLQKIGELNYAPVIPNESTLEIWRNNLVEFMKRLGLIILLPLLFGCAEIIAADTDSAADYWNAAHNAALEGNYILAAEQLGALQQQKFPAMSANCAYDLGYAAKMNGKPELALFYFEQAHLLKPWDDDIQLNLNLLRHNFLQKSVNSPTNPSELLTFLVQHFRPAQYAGAIVVFWSMLFIWFIFWRRHRRVVNWSILVGGIIVLSCLVGAMIYEIHGPYNSSRALVVASRAEFYRLPNELGNLSDGSLAGGSSVEVVERHGNFVRVKDGRRDGWVKADTVKLLQPEVLN